MGIRTIIADDNPAIRRSLCDMLKKHHEVKIIGETGNGKETVERCPSLRPDVVTIDVHMPDLNGIEAARQTISQHPQIKVLALSGDSDLHLAPKLVYDISQDLESGSLMSDIRYLTKYIIPGVTECM